MVEEGRKEIFYLTTHSTHFIYGYMASDIWLRTILIAKKLKINVRKSQLGPIIENMHMKIAKEETRCRHMGYSFRLTARVLLYAPSHKQDNTYHSLCYTSCGALAGMRNSSMGTPHEGSTRTLLPRSYILLLSMVECPLMVQWVIRSIPHGGSIELFIVQSSAL